MLHNVTLAQDSREQSDFQTDLAQSDLGILTGDKQFISVTVMQFSEHHRTQEITQECLFSESLLPPPDLGTDASLYEPHD